MQITALIAKGYPSNRLTWTLILLLATNLNSRAGEGTVAGTYDSLNRLASIRYPNGSRIIYSYDAAGNRTSYLATAGGSDKAEILVEESGSGPLVDGVGSVSFGSFNASSPAPSRTFTIRNQGLLELTGIAVTKLGPNAVDFTVAVASLATSLAPGGSTTFEVTFKPGTPGPKTAALQIASSDAEEGLFDIALTGSADAVPDIALEVLKGSSIASGGSRDFGTVALKKKGKETFVIRNTGNSNLAGIAITLSGLNAGEFVVKGNFTAPIKPGKIRKFTVQFAPTSGGIKQAQLAVTSNDPDESPYLVNLVGSGPILVDLLAALPEDPAPAGAVIALDPALDSDGDGLSDLLEFLTGSDPQAASASPARLVLEDGRIAVIYPRLKSAHESGAGFTVEWTEDMNRWSSDGVEERVLSEANGIQKVRAEVPTNGARQKFLRLRVSAAP